MGADIKTTPSLISKKGLLSVTRNLSMAYDSKTTTSLSWALTYFSLLLINLLDSNSSICKNAFSKLMYLLPSKSLLNFGVLVIVTILGNASVGVFSIIQFLCLYIVVLIVLLILFILCLLYRVDELVVLLAHVPTFFFIIHNPL